MRGITPNVFPLLAQELPAARKVSPVVFDDGLACPRAAFFLAVLAVFIEFVLSENTLFVLGLGNSTAPGGNPLLKFHPATYLAIFAALTSIAQGHRRGGGLGILMREAPALLGFLAVTLFCALYAVVNVGVTGVGVYIDTYLSAGCIGVVLVTANQRQRTFLARLILMLCVINVAISVVESIRQEHFIPLEIDGKTIDDLGDGDFRPAALYTHPLAGAMITAFAVFLVLALDYTFVTTSLLLFILAVGLFSFGGRAAIAATAGLLALRACLTFFNDLFRRRVNLTFIAGSLLVIFVLIPALTYLVAATPVGDRLVNRWYFDDSAEVRVVQWQILNHLTFRQALFGTPGGDLLQIYSMVGLTGVENPFLLLFLNLGLIGLPVFCIGLAALFIHLYQTHSRSKWLLLAALLIISSSNSIGTKAPDLFMLVVFASAMAARPTRRMRLRDMRASHTLSRLADGLAERIGRRVPPGSELVPPAARQPRRLSNEARYRRR